MCLYCIFIITEKQDQRQNDRHSAVHHYLCSDYEYKPQGEEFSLRRQNSKCQGHSRSTSSQNPGSEYPVTNGGRGRPTRPLTMVNEINHTVQQSNLQHSLQQTQVRLAWYSKTQISRSRILSSAKSGTGTAYYLRANVWTTSQHTFECSCGHSKICYAVARTIAWMY